MKIFLIFLISLTAFAQDSLTPGTNPLANTLPPPISSYEVTGRSYTQSPKLTNYFNSINSTNSSSQSKMTFQEKMNTLNLPPDAQYSQNVKDYLYQQENPQPLEAFKDDRVKFSDYNKPPLTTAVPEHENNSKSHDWSKTLWMIFGLFCVFITFITLLFSKRTKRF